YGRLADGPAPAGGEPRGRTWMAVPICAPKLVGDPLVPGAPTEVAPPAGGSVVLGVLALYDRHGTEEFDDTDLDTLRTFAGQAGEEFVVLLPETDAFGGVTVAERLGAVIRGAGVDIGVRRGGGGQHIAVSVSIGIAVYPDHGLTAGQLLEAADDALYAAKEAG